MAAKTRNISSLIESQLPGFIVSEYENFSKFVEKYYEQLESQGQPLDIISNVTKYCDINYYEKNLLNQFTELSSSITETDTTIVVEDATSFPEQNGYIKIGNEICFYKERTDTEFLEVSRGVSGNTTLGDLYESSKFVTTQAEPHYVNDTVYNVSNLFLYAFVKSFESQYLGGFPEAYLKGDVDKRVLIKNISDFYKAKGTDRSIKFIFNSIVSKSAEDTPETYNPKDFTIKASTSDWISNYSIKAKVLTGDIKKLVGNKLIQKTSTSYASAIVDAVNYGGDGGIFELVLSPGSVNGSFSIAAQTKLKTDISVTDTIGDRIDVYSTLGLEPKGNIIVNSETIAFVEKNVNQFIINGRSNPNTTHIAGTDVYSDNVITCKYDGGTVTLLALGVLYNLNVSNPNPYSSSGDKVQISKSGFISNHPVINGADWFLNTNFRKAFSALNQNISDAIGDLNSDVSAIYEDDQYFYICSSGYPHHSILNQYSPSNLGDQKFLKLIRKYPINTTEIYPTSNRDIGILIDGSVAYSNKDFDSVKYGNITSVVIENKGVGYKNPPFVLINNEANKARCFLAGEVVDRIELLSEDVYNEDPTITITSGRNAKLKPVVTNGEITSIRIEDPGEYYSSAPTIRIFDALGKGAFAEYEAIISPEGQITKCQKINGGRFYSRNSLIVEVIPAGSGAFASAKIREWIKDRFKKNELLLDSNNSYVFSNFNPKFTDGYGVVANPANLRFRSADNINSVLDESTGVKIHSPILGFAYDGNPIYGPYGFSDPGNSNSTVVRMSSGYQLKNNRQNGPSLVDYPLGTFVDDYEWIPSVNSNKTKLDENNGRFCVTPEYPNGTYAYFISIDGLGNPTFPYIIGKNFYSLPVDSNYNSNISQDDIPKNVVRYRDDAIDSNGANSLALIGDTTKGNVSGGYSDYSPETFSVGSQVFIDSNNTGGFGAKSVVSSVNGKEIVSLESVQNKAIAIDLKQNAYLFAGDTVFQSEGLLLNQIIVDNLEITGQQDSDSPNVKVVNDLAVASASSFRVILDDTSSLTQGEIIGDVVNDNRLVVRNVNGTFTTDLPLFATIKVLNILLDKNATYSKGSTLSFIREDDGVIFGTATVLEGSLRQNSLKIRVISGEFFASDDFIIKSNVLSDTSSSKIIKSTSLSENLQINTLNDKVAIVETNGTHNLGIGDKINVDIFPDDSLTETTYYVRKRLYQKCILQDLKFNGEIVDTGIGRFGFLNSGSDYREGVYNDIELIFVDSSKARKNIGKPGDSGNARARITVFELGGGYGRVSFVEITNKGFGYRKSDILTVADDDLNRLSSSISTSRLNIIVDHVGVSAENTEISLISINDISNGDFLQIGEEVVKVTSTNKDAKLITVERAQKNTKAVDHFNGQEVNFYETSYKFDAGFGVLGTTQNTPYVISYNSNTRELILAYDYGVSNPIRVLQSSIFFDQNIASKFVKIESVEEPKYKLEFSKDEINFIINPVINIQKYYKYTFDTSHFSMVDTYLDFSSSLNYNLFTEEKNVSSNLPGTVGSFVSIKLGFGPNISSNEYEQKIPVNFNNYYYFIKASADVDTDESSLKVIDDPLSGENFVIYSTENKFVYSMNSLPQYDGTGTIKYDTTSQFAIGSIKALSIVDTGSDYDLIPLCRGILPTSIHEALVTASIDTTTGYLSSIIVNNQGQNYSKPVALITNGDGFDYKLECISENGRIKAVNILNPGQGFTYDPEIRIFESDVKVFFTSNNIGIPKNIKLISNGFGYNSDYSTLPSFKSTNTFVLKDFEDDSFYGGEKIAQYENGILVANAIVSKNGWRVGSNLLKVENINGIFRNDLPIKGFARSKTATIVAQLETSFSVDIKTYFDNLGRFNSEKGKLSSNSQKLSDSYFYQDYSYVIKSRTPIDFWRDLIKETTHPAGFQLFGELIVESEGTTAMPQNVKEIETHSFINLKPQNISIINTVKYLTENILSVANSNIERGIGSVSIDTFDSSETIAKELILSAPFDGDFDPNSGVLYGTQTFTLIDKKAGTAFSPYSENSLIISLDGVLQEPGKSFTVKGNKITFAQPPFGKRIAEGQEVAAQNFYCRAILFKTEELNSQYIRKLRNIADQFDGEQRIFDLYEEDGSIVKSLPNEKFIVALNGVLQNAKTTEEEPFGNSYAIIRSVDPDVTDKIAFTEPPISHGELYDSTDDIVIREKCFIYSVGSYKRLTIDSRTVKYRGKGPFLILNEVQKSVVKIDDPLYAVVFIDGVLQIPGKSYQIVGPNITFTSPLKYHEDESGKQTLQKVSILLFYGIDKLKTLTFYDFEPNAYYTKSNLIIDGASNQQEFFTWIADYFSDNVIVSQNGTTLGKVKSVKPKTSNINLTLLSSSYEIIDNSDFTFVNPINNDSFTLTQVFESSITYFEDEDGIRKLQVDVPSWLFGTKLGRNAYEERSKLYANLNIGDLIQIDGESDYREIISIPELVNTKQYNTGQFLPGDIYSRVQTSNYNDITRGEGLSITAEIDSSGRVTKLNWNKRDLMLYFNNKVLLQPTAYQYYTVPVIDFIPLSQNGGGARAEAICIGGNVVDIVLVENGYGYDQPPKVVISRGYNRIKNKSRKFDVTTVLNISPPVAFSDSLVASSVITLFASGPTGLSIFSLIDLAAEGAFKEAAKQITYIIIPPLQVVTFAERLAQNEFVVNLPPIEIDYEIQSIELEVVSTIDARADIISSTAIISTDREITSTISKQINEAFVQLDTASINDIGAFLDAPLSETDTIIFIPNTLRFPDSSRLLVGREIVYYERKKQDRFLDVTRGADGTTAQTHEAGDYLRHLPKIVSVVPVGTSTIQSITSIESIKDVLIEVVKTFSAEPKESSITHDSTVLSANQQIEIDNSDFEVLPWIGIIQTPVYNVITVVHSTSSQVQNVVEASKLDSITSTITAVKETNIQVFAEQQINVDVSEILSSTQIVSATESSYESVFSSVVTSSYNAIVVENDINVVSAVTIENYSSNYILRNESTIESIVSSINTIENIINEILVIPPVSYLEVRNSHSVTRILYAQVPAITTVAESLIVSPIEANIELTNNLNINILDTRNTVVSTHINAGYEHSYITSQTSKVISTQLEVIDVVTYGINTSHSAHSTSVTLVNSTIQSSVTSVTNTAIYNQTPLKLNIDPVINCTYISSSNQISSKVNPNSSQTTVQIDTSTGIRGSSIREIDFNIGILDFFTELFVLENPIKTRNQGFFTLSEPINTIISRDGSTIEVTNKNVGRDEFFEGYNLGNAGYTITAFENNRFIDTGVFKVSGSIQAITYAYPNLTINDFEQRRYSAITLTGEFFNLAVPSINEIGSMLTSNISDTSTTMVIDNASGFPDNGRIIINKEVIEYTSKSGNTLLGLIRGADNTVPASHTSNDYLRSF
jgi:hypothetical protein